MDFDKAQLGTPVPFPNCFTVIGIGRNHGNQHNDPSVGHQQCDLTDTSDVLGSILR
jgi:hypothetical protein